MRGSRVVSVVPPPVVERSWADVPKRLEVTTHGPTTTIKCDAITAAPLGGREVFGEIAETQAALLEAIADAWYDAGCPPSRKDAVAMQEP